MSFNWQCHENPGLMCSFVNGSLVDSSNADSVLRIPPQSLSADKNYTFTLLVKKQERISSASVMISYSSLMVPKLLIDECQQSINKNEEHSFSVSVWSTQPDAIKYQWRITTDDDESWVATDKDTLTGLTLRTIKLRPWTFPQGAKTLNVHIQVTDITGTSFATFKAVVNEPPSLGTLTVTPNEGHAMSTRFRLRTDGWQDIDIPLKYMFAYYYSQSDLLNGVGVAMNPLTDMTVASELSTLLPGGNSSLEYAIYIQVVASDFLGATTNISCAVKVDYDAKTNRLNYDSNLAKVPSDWVLQKLLVISYVAKERALSTTYLEVCSCSSHGACDHREKCQCLDGWYGDDCSLSQGALNEQKDMLGYLLKEALEDKPKKRQSRRESLLRLSSIALIAASTPLSDVGAKIKLIDYVTVLASDDRVDYMEKDYRSMVDILGSALAATTNNVTQSNQIYDALQQVMKHYQEGRAPNQTVAFIDTKYINVKLKRVTPSLLLDLSVLDSDSDLLVLIPKLGIKPISSRKTSNPELNTEELYDLQIIEWKTKLYSVPNDADTTNTVSVNLVSAGKIHNRHTRTQLTNAFKLRLKVKATASQPGGAGSVCSFYDTIINKWSTDGCRLASMDSNDGKTLVTCGCSHMTSFAVLSEAAQEVYRGSNLKHAQNANFHNYKILLSMTFYFVVAAVLLTFLFAFFGRLKDKQDREALKSGNQVFGVSLNEQLMTYIKAKAKKRVHIDLTQDDPSHMSWFKTIYLDVLKVVKVTITSYNH